MESVMTWLREHAKFVIGAATFIAVIVTLFVPDLSDDTEKILLALETFLGGAGTYAVPNRLSGVPFDEGDFEGETGEFPVDEQLPDLS